MIAQRFDDLAYRSSSLSVFCSKALKKIFDTKLWEDIVFTLAVTFACGFYQYEMFFLPAKEISQILTVCTVAVWIWASLINGFLKHSVFVVFTLLSWTVPQVLIIYNANMPLYKYNALLDTLAQLSFILFRAPLRQVSETFGINGFITSVILVIICEGMFSLGCLIRKYSRNSVWYCKFRVHYNI